MNTQRKASTHFNVLHIQLDIFLHCLQHLDLEPFKLEQSILISIDNNKNLKQEVLLDKMTVQTDQNIGLYVVTSTTQQM